MSFRKRRAVATKTAPTKFDSFSHFIFLKSAKILSTQMEKTRFLRIVSFDAHSTFNKFALSTDIENKSNFVKNVSVFFRKNINFQTISETLLFQSQYMKKIDIV